MTNISVIENKISGIKKYLKILSKYKKYSRKKIEGDIDLKGALERYLYLAVQSTIDAADALISHKHLRKPSTLSENFYILEEAGILSADLTAQLAKMAGFRNIIAHDYEKVDFGVVYDVLQTGLKDIEKFLKEIARVLR